MEHRQDEPTDMMCRRIPLPLCGRFLLFGTTVAITTNYEPIMRATNAAGLVRLTDKDELPGMKWEIVAIPGASLSEDWDCNVTVGNHSLYLSMGREQWFAFDLETGNGAGFVVASDSGTLTDTNAELYLLAVACNVGAGLRSDVENARCD
ncbi:MAG TPA: hypothetical protein VE178_03155 [Silvibacterium sp.]|nr:hypothetical protein [Silvibacterium sp.]